MTEGPQQDHITTTGDPQEDGITEDHKKDPLIEDLEENLGIYEPILQNKSLKRHLLDSI